MVSMTVVCAKQLQIKAHDLQIAGGVSGHRGRCDLLAVPDCASGALCVQLGPLCGYVRGHLLLLRALLHGGGDAGDPPASSALLQKLVELPGRADSNGTAAF